MSLPKGYKRLEYIESSGTQYVDTLFYPKYNSRVVVDIEGLGTSTGAVFGTRSTSSATASLQFNVYRNSATSIRSDYFGTNASLSISDASARTTIDKNANVVTLFGSKITNTAVSSGECTYPLYLFAMNSVGSVAVEGSFKLYSCQCYDAGVLKRDFIPCKTDTGEIGLWDDIYSVFYGNAGTGTFTAGPIVPEVVDESEITELEYIQSNGTQYVNTVFCPKGNTRIVSDCDLISGTYPTAFGSLSNGAGYFGLLSYSDSVFRIFYNTSILDVSVDSTKGRHILDLNQGALLVDGEQVGSVATASFTGVNPVYLLTFSTKETDTQFNTSAKYYSCQAYDNGLLQRDYIPAMLSNGEVGLYDRVFHKFYRNAGTGEFTAGPEMAHEGYTELEYIESSGTQFIESAVSVKSTSGFKIDFAVVSGSSERGLIGGFNYGGLNNNFGLYSGQWAAQYGDNQSYFFGSVDTERHTISQNVEAGSVFFDGVQVLSGATFYDNTARSFRLFCYNGGDSYPTFWIGSFKIYSCKIYDNGTEVRIYIPMRHPSGVVGLWDSVNERFYASATTTDFIAGPEAARAPDAPANFRVESESDTAVTLAWDAREDAQGYRLYRMGELLADTTELTYTVEVEPFAGAVFTLTAYNENGEGAGTRLTYFNVPENPVLYLVTDRAQTDVDERNSKGYYAASDLNRVGYAMSYLAGRISETGTQISVAPKTDWTDEEWMDTASAAVYLGYLSEIRNAVAVLSTTPKAPEDLEQFTFEEANDIEQILVDIDQMLTYVFVNLLYAGEIFAGEV